ncbi:MAG: hypothetical protein MHM6MM_009040 [Cercozoa sp. M6MM]
MHSDADSDVCSETQPSSEQPSSEQPSSLSRHDISVAPNNGTQTAPTSTNSQLALLHHFELENELQGVRELPQHRRHQSHDTAHRMSRLRSLRMALSPRHATRAQRLRDANELAQLNASDTQMLRRLTVSSSADARRAFSHNHVDELDLGDSRSDGTETSEPGMSIEISSLQSHDSEDMRRIIAQREEQERQLRRMRQRRQHRLQQVEQPEDRGDSESLKTATRTLNSRLSTPTHTRPSVAHSVFSEHLSQPDELDSQDAEGMTRTQLLVHSLFGTLALRRWQKVVGAVEYKWDTLWYPYEEWRPPTSLHVATVFVCFGLFGGLLYWAVFAAVTELGTPENFGCLDPMPWTCGPFDRDCLGTAV